MKLKGVFILLACLCLMGFSINEWPVYKAPDGSFSIRLNGTPKVETESEQVQGGKLTISFYQIEIGTFVNGVIRMDFPMDMSKVPSGPLLEKMSQQFIKSMKGTVVSKKSVTVLGYPGMDFSLSIKDKGKYNIVTMRSVVVKENIYMLLYGDETSKFNKDVAGQFFGSFKLLEKKTP